MAYSSVKQFKRNTLAAAITLAVCNSATAQFYGGITIVSGSIEMDARQTQTTLVPPNTSISDLEFGGDRSIGGSLSLGYRWFRDDWLLSTELEYGKDTGRTESNDLWYVENFNEDRRISASIIAGPRIANDLYLTVKIGYTETDLNFNTTLPGVMTFSDLDVHGVHGAIGVERFINKALFNRDLSIRAEYGRTFYSDEDSIGSSPATIITNNYKGIENEMLTVGVTLEF